MNLLNITKHTYISINNMRRGIFIEFIPNSVTNTVPCITSTRTQGNTDTHTDTHTYKQTEYNNLALQD